jgi:hypothetical protein
MQVISNIYDGQYKLIAKASNISLISEYSANRKPIKLINYEQSATSSASTSQQITIMADSLPRIILYQSNE